METLAALTERQREIYLKIYEGARDRGYQPSLRELMDHFGFTSPNAVVLHIRALTRKGWVGKSLAQGRAVRILRNPDGSTFRGFVQKPRDAEEAREGVIEERVVAEASA